MELYEFKASLVCKGSSRKARSTERNPVLKRIERKKGKEHDYIQLML